MTITGHDFKPDSILDKLVVDGFVMTGDYKNSRLHLDVWKDAIVYNVLGLLSHDRDYESRCELFRKAIEQKMLFADGKFLVFLTIRLDLMNLKAYSFMSTLRCLHGLRKGQPVLDGVQQYRITMTPVEDDEDQIQACLHNMINDCPVADCANGFVDDHGKTCDMCGGLSYVFDSDKLWSEHINRLKSNQEKLNQIANANRDTKLL